MVLRCFHVHLELRSYDIYGDKSFADALKVNVTLTILDLRSNNVCDESAKTLAGALKASTVLTVLISGNNAIGDEGLADTL